MSYSGMLWGGDGGAKGEVIYLHKDLSFSLRCGSGAPLLSSPSSGWSDTEDWLAHYGDRQKM